MKTYKYEPSRYAANPDNLLACPGLVQVIEKIVADGNVPTIRLEPGVPLLVTPDNVLQIVSEVDDCNLRTYTQDGKLLSQVYIIGSDDADWFCDCDSGAYSEELFNIAEEHQE